MQCTDFDTLYKQKLCTPEQAIQQISPQSQLITFGCYNTPAHLTKALVSLACENYFEDIVDIFLFRCSDEVIHSFNNANALKKLRLLMPFVSKRAKMMIDQLKNNGELINYPSFLITHFSTMEECIINRRPNVDAHLMQVSPMDEHGYFSTGIDGSFSIPIAHQAKKLIFEVNPQMPRTFGENLFHIRDVSALIENETPLFTLPSVPHHSIDEKIAAHIAPHIKDGCCIQLGVGSVPNAMSTLLQNYNDLGVHTELLCDAILSLIQNGNVTNKYKNIQRYLSVYNISMLTQQSLYQYLHNNPSIRCYRASYVNDPRVISSIDNMISINSFVEIDLFGQVASESVHYKQLTSTGGQVDFVRGARFSKGGKSFLAAHSTAKNGTISKIVPQLKNFVTTARTEVQYIVTENGCTNLVGLTCRERAKALINLAHNDFKDELIEKAKEMHLFS